MKNNYNHHTSKDKRNKIFEPNEQGRPTLDSTVEQSNILAFDEAKTYTEQQLGTRIKNHSND